MKKTLLLLLLACGFASAQNVSIPNANLKAKLLSASTQLAIAKDASGNNIKIDTNNDGQIQLTEALTVYQLDVRSSSITDMTGLNSFTNLKALWCGNNLFTSLAIPSLVNLNELDCGYSSLTSLDLTNLTSLKKFTCNQVPTLSSVSLSGLTQLELINMQNNQLTTLNLSGLTALKTLYIGGGDITNLNLVNLPNLVDLYCGGNAMTSLDLSGVPSLVEVDCRGNGMTSINLSGLSNLKVLKIASNAFATVDLSGVPNLETLWCSQNNLTSLDLSGFPNLHGLNAWENNLTSLILPNPAIISDILDVSYNNLTSLDLSNANFTGSEWVNLTNNNLVELFIKNGMTDTNISLDANPTLQFICTDASEIDAFQSMMTLLDYSNCVVNSYCSFVPGGDYNTITGTMIFDGQNDGCGPNDFAQPFIKLKINDGAQEGATFTSQTGNYNFYTQSGNFTVSPQFENPSYYTASPINAVVNFPVVDNSIATHNFCITANGVHPNAEIVIAPLTPARPGFDADYKIVLKNTGNQVLSGNIYFYYDDQVLDYVASSTLPSAQSTGLMTWAYANLYPFESRSIMVKLNVNAPTETPAVNIGDELIFNVGVDPIGGNETVFSYFQTVVGSFDPNDITCLEGDVINPLQIGDYLHYIINFENTGTAPAENVVVKVAIDATKYDVESLQLLNVSHPVEAKVQGSIVEFIFKNIDLETNGHGNILLKARTKSTLNVGDSVSKMANIFFDYNFPIETNDAVTVFQGLDVQEHAKDLSIKIYPNPSRGFVKVASDAPLRSVEVYDVQGRLLVKHLTENLDTAIDMTDKANGVYFFKIRSEKGIKIEKVIKK